MAILNKEKLEQCLNEYYEERYGRQNTDIWYRRVLNLRERRRDEAYDKNAEIRDVLDTATAYIRKKQETADTQKGIGCLFIL